MASCGLEWWLLWCDFRCEGSVTETQGKKNQLHDCRVYDADHRAQTKNEQLVNNFVAGTIGGTFGTILNTPMDVVKTRIQGYTGEGPKKYNWTLPSLALVAKEEGFV